MNSTSFLPTYTNRTPISLNIEAKSLTKIERVYQLLKQQQKSDSIPLTLLPFRTVHSIASDCLREFMEIALDILFRCDYDDFQENVLTTSCVNSFYAISSLCLGVKKTLKMKVIIDVEPYFNVIFTLPSGNFFTVTIFHLFAGIATQHIYQDPNYFSSRDNERRKKIGDLTSLHLKEFYECIDREVKQIFNSHTLDDLSASIILNVIKISKYKFNKSTILALKEELKNNATCVSSNKSFLYCVSTKIPRFGEKLIESVVDHAFLLEQYQCPKDQTTRVRLYQSWIVKATLLDEMSKHPLDETEKGTWNHKQWDAFLDRFEDFYCSDTGYLEPQKSMDCFGYNHNEVVGVGVQTDCRYPLVISHNNIITGISVRYIVEEFDPKDCTRNLKSIARKERFTP